MDLSTRAPVEPTSPAPHYQVSIPSEFLPTASRIHPAALENTVARESEISELVETGSLHIALGDEIPVSPAVSTDGDISLSTQFPTLSGQQSSISCGSAKIKVQSPLEVSEKTNNFFSGIKIDIPALSSAPSSPHIVIPNFLRSASMPGTMTSKPGVSKRNTGNSSILNMPCPSPTTNGSLGGATIYFGTSLTKSTDGIIANTTNLPTASCSSNNNVNSKTSMNVPSLKASVSFGAITSIPGFPSSNVVADNSDEDYDA